MGACCSSANTAHEANTRPDAPIPALDDALPAPPNSATPLQLDVAPDEPATSAPESTASAPEPQAVRRDVSATNLVDVGFARPSSKPSSRPGCIRVVAVVSSGSFRQRSSHRLDTEKVEPKAISAPLARRFGPRRTNSGRLSAGGNGASGQATSASSAQVLSLANHDARQPAPAMSHHLPSAASGGCPFSEELGGDGPAPSTSAANRCPFAPEEPHASAAARKGEGRGADGPLSADAQVETLWRGMCAGVEELDGDRRPEWPGPRAVYKTLMGEESDYEELLRSRADLRAEAEPSKVAAARMLAAGCWLLAAGCVAA